MELRLSGEGEGTMKRDLLAIRQTEGPTLLDSGPAMPSLRPNLLDQACTLVRVEAAVTGVEGPDLMLAPAEAGSRQVGLASIQSCLP